MECTSGQRRRPALPWVFAAVALVLANAVTPLVAVTDGWEAAYGTVYGTVVPWTVVGAQLLVTPLLIVWRRRPALAAFLAIGTALAGLLAMAGAPDELYTTYVSTIAWVPVALSATVPGMLMSNPGRRRTIAMGVLIAVATLVGARVWASSLNVAANSILHIAVPVLIGLYIGARLRMVQVLRDRAERAEREQHLLAEQARAAERTRLASEMHDVVSHRVSLMVLQAGALRLNAADDATRAAAEELRSTGCQALDELRDLVGVLRRPAPADRLAPAARDAPGGTPDTTGGDGGPVPEPQPTPDLGQLVTDARAAGMDVRLAAEGDAGRVAPVVARTVHRVAREALTNAGKYALGATVTVDVRYDTEHVRLLVTNTPPPDSGDTRLRATGAGTGLAGLRQRVEVVGGTFTAGPADGGGFTVAATMPIFVPAAEPAATMGPVPR